MLLGSCASDVGGHRLAINDPLDLIDDVQGPLRLYVLDSQGFGCDATVGMVTPEVPDLPEGMFEDAVADLSLTVSGSMASAEVSVPTGEFVVLVRGKGTDPVSGRTGVFIATGCAVQSVGSGETREVPITLLPITGSGVCGDGTLSPDEECEDGNTMAGDGCNATCRIEPTTINTTVAGTQNHPQVGGAMGRRWFVGFDSDNSTSLVRVLEPGLGAVTNPVALSTDGDIDAALSDIGPGTQLLSAFAVHASGRVAWAFVDFNPTPSDIRVVFTSQDRLPAGNTAQVVDGMASNPRIAFDGAGAAMVVYTDNAMASGAGAQLFAPDATTPLLGAPIAIGSAAMTTPVVAGLDAGFVVAFASGGDVFAQRFGADGAPRDATPIAVGPAAGTQDQPGVAAMSDGSFVVVWRDDTLDGAGHGIGYRAYGADGMPRGDAAALNTTTAGEQGAPAIAGGAGGYAVVFTDGAGIRARVLSPNATPILNRQAPPAAVDFPIAAAGSEPAVAAGGDGRFLAVWTDGGDIRGAAHPLP